MKTIKASVLAITLSSVVASGAMACVTPTGMHGSATGGVHDHADHGGVNTADLDPNFQNQLNAMIAAAEAEFGGNVGIYSGHRSIEHQQQLYDQAIATYGRADLPGHQVARPGSSMHNYGGAVDMSFNGSRVEFGSPISNWMGTNLERFGLHRPVNGEGWHVEPIGQREALRAGGQTQAMAAAGCDPEDLAIPEVVLMDWLATYAAGSVPPGSF